MRKQTEKEMAWSGNVELPVNRIIQGAETVVDYRKFL